MTTAYAAWVLAALWSVICWAGPVAATLVLMIPVWHIAGWLIREHAADAPLWVQVILPRLRLVPPPGSRDGLDAAPASPAGDGRRFERAATVIEFPSEQSEQHRKTA